MDSTSGKSTRAANFTAGVHIDRETFIKVQRYAQDDREPIDRVVLQIGPSLQDFSLYLDREDVERLHTILEGERQWFIDQEGARIHATLTASECLGPECLTHGVGVKSCPTCDSPVELTPSGALTCREHGSSHYRVEHAAAPVLPDEATHYTAHDDDTVTFTDDNGAAVSL